MSQPDLELVCLVLGEWTDRLTVQHAEFTTNVSKLLIALQDMSEAATLVDADGIFDGEDDFIQWSDWLAANKRAAEEASVELEMIVRGNHRP